MYPPEGIVGFWAGVTGAVVAEEGGRTRAGGELSTADKSVNSTVVDLELSLLAMRAIRAGVVALLEGEGEAAELVGEPAEETVGDTGIINRVVVVGLVGAATSTAASDSYATGFLPAAISLSSRALSSLDLSGGGTVEDPPFAPTTGTATDLSGDDFAVVDRLEGPERRPVLSYI